MIAGIDKSELVLLKFSKKEALQKLEWEHSREFEYNHEMYDVVDSKVFGDSIVFWCWWDHEETKLNRQLKSLVALTLGNDVQNKKSQVSLIVHLSTLYYSDINNRDFISPDIKSELFFPYLFNKSSLEIPPPDPPPRTV